MCAPSELVNAVDEVRGRSSAMAYLEEMEKMSPEDGNISGIVALAREMNEIVTSSWYELIQMQGLKGAEAQAWEWAPYELVCAKRSFFLVQFKFPGK